MAGTLGAHGATAVHSTGDLAGSLPGVPVASAIAKAIADGNGPDLMMLGTTYDGRDIAARLSVAIDKPVRFSWDAERVVLFDKASGDSLQHSA